MKAIGYTRVSTKAQGKNGFGPDLQSHALEQYCAANGFDLVTIIPDVMSGRMTDKMYGRAAAIAALRSGLASVLIVNAMDRATRNTLDGLHLIRDAQAEGWRVPSLDSVDSDKFEKLWLTVRMGFAEEECDKISLRTKQGLIKARQSGKQLGRPSQIPHNVIARVVGMRMSDKLGAKAIATKLTAEGLTAPGGSKQWHYSTVRSIFAREGIV